MSENHGRCGVRTIARRSSTTPARPPFPDQPAVVRRPHRRASAAARTGRRTATISRHHSMCRTAWIHAACELSDTYRGRRGRRRGRALGKRAIPHGRWRCAGARGRARAALVRGASRAPRRPPIARPVAAGVSRPIPAGAAPTARSAPRSPRLTRSRGFRTPPVAQVRVRPDRRGSRRSAERSGKRRRPATGRRGEIGFPSHLGNHFAAGHWPGRRRAASTAESLRAPNEDRRRTGRAGRSATFRPPLGRARTAQQAASRRDSRPAIRPAC